MQKYVYILCKSGLTETAVNVGVTWAAFPSTCKVEHRTAYVANDLNTCQTYEDGTTKSEDGKTCTQNPKPSECTLNCKACNSDGEWTECENGYELRLGKCQQYADGYFQSGTEMCKTRCTI